jgi:hypothetical protein
MMFRPVFALTRSAMLAACGLALTSIAITGCSSSQNREAATTAEQNSEQTAPAKWYENEIRAFEAADKKNPPDTWQVLFVGSSSFRLWKTLERDMSPAPIINRGFGGSKTSEVLEVFDRTVLPYKPSVIAYYCGDNDLGVDGTDWETPADNFIAFEQRARELWPDVHVFYVPIKASLQRWKKWPNMKQANDKVRAYCDANLGVTYLDTVTPTLLADGTPDPSIFEGDGLHINEKGYAIWTTVIREQIVEAWNARRK